MQPDAAERVLPPWPILDAPAVTIEGRLVSGPAPMWLSPDGGLLCGVEQFAIQHYRTQVFSRFFLLHAFRKTPLFWSRVDRKIAFTYWATLN